MCQKLQKGVETLFGRCFAKWGNFVARRPCLVLLIGLGVSMLMGIGTLFPQQFDDQQKAWSPVDSQAKKDSNKIDELPLEKMEFMAIIYRTRNDENVITSKHFKNVVEFHQQLLAYEGGRFVNQDCIKGVSRCLLSAHIAEFFEDSGGQTNLNDIPHQDDQILDIANNAKNINLGTRVLVEEIFGGTEPANPQADQNGKFDYTKARSLKFTYLLRSNETASDYIYDLIDPFVEAHHSDNIQMEVYSQNLVYQALNVGVQNDIGIINISIFLLVNYAIFMLGTCHPVGLKILPGALGIFCCILAYLSSVGLCQMMQLKQSQIHQLLPFLLLGVGVDDMFVIVGVSDQLNPKMSTARKLSKTLKIAGFSIFITTLTDCIAFFVNGTSRLPALSSFTIYAGVGLLFDFFYQITIFSAYFSYDLKRRANGKGEICGLCRCKPTCFIFCCGKCVPHDQLQHQQIAHVPDQKSRRIDYSLSYMSNHKMEGGESRSVERDSTPVSVRSIDNWDIKLPYASNDKTEDIKNSNSKKEASPPPPVNSQQQNGEPQDFQDDRLYLRESFVQKFLTKYFSKFIVNTKAQIGVLGFFVALTIFAIAASASVETNILPEYFINDDLRFKTFYHLLDEYYPETNDTGGFYTDDTSDLLEETNQAKYLQVIRILNRSTDCQFCDSPMTVKGSVKSWYAYFLEFMQQTDTQPCTVCQGSQCFNQSQEVILREYVGACLYQFLNQAAGNSLKDTAIKFKAQNNEVTKIESSLSFFTLKDPGSSDQAVDILDNMRKLTDQFGPAGSFTYSRMYLIWEQYADFDREVLVCLISSLAAIYIVVLLSSGNFCSSLFVFSMMGLVDLNLVAMIWWWGLELNFITMLNVILALGLSVDYSAHITHGFNVTNASESEATTNRERRKFKVQKSFKLMGSSVVHGAMSTFLAIVMISATTNYVFVAFFKQWFSIILFGMLHAFFLLPVLLSMCGPLSKDDLK